MAPKAQTSNIPCPSCNRNGGVPGVLRNSQGQPVVCPNCNGTGQKPAPVIRVPFDYAFPTVALTALQAGVAGVLAFDYDADFEHIWIVSSQTGLYSVLVTDTSTNRQLANANINSECYAGTAALPFPLVEPYIWARSSAASASFTDRSDADNSIQLVFRGYKLYPAQAPQQGSPGRIVNAAAPQ